LHSTDAERTAFPVIVPIIVPTERTASMPGRFGIRIPDREMALKKVPLEEGDSRTDHPVRRDRRCFGGKAPTDKQSQRNAET